MDSDDLDVCEEEAGEMVLVGLKEVKKLASHPTPRLPVLTTMAVLTNASLHPQPSPPLTPHRSDSSWSLPHVLQVFFCDVYSNPIT